MKIKENRKGKYAICLITEAGTFKLNNKLTFSIVCKFA